MNAEKLNAEQFEAYKAKGELGRLPRSADVPSDAIALKVSGDCLSPRVRDGQLVIVEPRLPVSGDIAAIWLKGEPMPAIKILRTEILGFPHNPKSDCITSINVEQLNPPERFTFWADRVECIARVHSVVRKSFADARRLYDWPAAGLRLHLTRLALGITQEEAAAAYGVTVPTYLKYEAGGRQRTSTGWVNFAGKYDVCVNWLVRGETSGLGPHLSALTKGNVRILGSFSVGASGSRVHS